MSRHDLKLTKSLVDLNSKIITFLGLEMFMRQKQIVLPSLTIIQQRQKRALVL